MEHFFWQSKSSNKTNFYRDNIWEQIHKLNTPYFILKESGSLRLIDQGEITSINGQEQLPCLGILPAISAGQFGAKGFQRDHGTQYSYMAGAMANGIASVDMVIALGEKGYLGSFGTGGLSFQQVEEAICKIQKTLPYGPCAFNLLHNPYDNNYEMTLVELFLKKNVCTVEAAAYIHPSAALAYYRISGLQTGDQGRIIAKHKIIAKLSRQEVALKFMQPVPELLVSQLLSAGKITSEQADLSQRVPFADDITVEADSGGHTDNRPLISLLPSILAIRDRVQNEYPYEQKIRVGAGGGISTPHSAIAAFNMCADYIVTGSINQSCVESGTSQKTRELLAKAEMADVMMAPSADMFELGAKVQVLKKGTMFPLIAQKLYKLYNEYASIEDLPPKEKENLEKKIFRKDMETIWQETMAYFQNKDPRIIQKALDHPQKKMALIFRWFLGKSSLWAISGDEDRMKVAQIWCGQAMGAFNTWVKGTHLENSENRKVAEIAHLIMSGTALLNRVNFLKLLGFPPEHPGSEGSTDPIRVF